MYQDEKSVCTLALEHRRVASRIFEWGRRYSLCFLVGGLPLV